MFHLNNIFNMRKETCKHEFPDTIIIADAVDRKGEFVRIDYCRRCKDYRYKEIDNKNGDSCFFEKIKQSKYEIFCDFNKLHS
jgi:hypothetical protein